MSSRNSLSDIILTNNYASIPTILNVTYAWGIKQIYYHFKTIQNYIFKNNVDYSDLNFLCSLEFFFKRTLFQMVIFGHNTLCLRYNKNLNSIYFYTSEVYLQAIWKNFGRLAVPGTGTGTL